ncbi:OpgC family protein [Lichenicoccus sp.]|uniref:OpgC family protein n=1 Tax=Lichenicoccus sp. TaxID=2781899 RepID=UPI003D09EDFD
MTNSNSFPRPRRDHRVDALRGAALAMMFVDHIPDNLLNRLTLRNLGFCDAAEIFVLLAGFASMLAYGRAFAREGVGAALSKLGRRIGRLYVYHIGMLLVSIGVVTQWRHYYPVPVRFLEPELAHGFASLWRAMLLYAQPASLNILPLYIVLLGLFPLVYLTSRAGIGVALALSGALWALINLYPQINLPNWFDPDGWFFDPFAWQFLFTLGAMAAITTQQNGGDLPRHRWIVTAAWTYLGFSAMQAFPWSDWNLPNLAPFDIAPPQKTPLSPLRLIDVLSIFYLVQSSARMSRAAASRGGQVLAVLGRHSLEVFAVGTTLDLLAQLLFVTWGNPWLLQIGINVVGLGGLLLLARWLDRRKSARRPAMVRHAAGHAPHHGAAAS